MVGENNNSRGLIANRVSELAQSLEQNSVNVQNLSEVSQRAAQVLTKFGDYLDSRSTADLVIDAVKLVRRYPLPLLFGIAGVCAGMMLTRGDAVRSIGASDDSDEDTNGADVLH